MNDTRYTTGHLTGADGGPNYESRKIAGAGKIIRATTSIFVFGIPLLIGAAGLVGFAVFNACKRFRQRVPRPSGR
jgi:hypothetical protein